MKHRVFELCVAFLALVMAKAFGRELAELSWPSFLAFCAAGFVGSSLGAYLMLKMRKP